MSNESAAKQHYQREFNTVEFCSQFKSIMYGDHTYGNSFQSAGGWEGRMVGTAVGPTRLRHCGNDGEHNSV